jgi:hypothetical protein
VLQCLELWLFSMMQLGVDKFLSMNGQTMKYKNS